MTLMTAIGSIGSLLAGNNIPSDDEKIAIFSGLFSDICDCNRSHCRTKRKLVVTDSMDGDFAPMMELAELRKKHGFLLVIDDAHGTFVCGKIGGGVAEEFNCEKDVDICIGTLSKAAGCHGGFIACRHKIMFQLLRLLMLLLEWHDLRHGVERLFGTGWKTFICLRESLLQVQLYP